VCVCDRRMCNGMVIERGMRGVLCEGVGACIVGRAGGRAWSLKGMFGSCIAEFALCFF
jgi:hypothetical protein